MNPTTEDRLQRLEERLLRLEDEAAVHRLIVRYGLAVDAGDAEAAMALFTEDTIYDVGAVKTGLEDEASKPLIMRGRAAVGEMVKSAAHQRLLPNSAHTIGPVVAEVDGDQARATGYTRIYHLESGDYRLFRIAVNHWQLRREDGIWLIHRRVSRVLGSDEVQSIMREALGDGTGPS